MFLNSIFNQHAIEHRSIPWSMHSRQYNRKFLKVLCNYGNTAEHTQFRYLTALTKGKTWISSKSFYFMNAKLYNLLHISIRKTTNFCLTIITKIGFLNFFNLSIYTPISAYSPFFFALYFSSTVLNTHVVLLSVKKDIGFYLFYLFVSSIFLLLSMPQDSLWNIFFYMLIRLFCINSRK